MSKQICTKCREDKKLSEFSKDKSSLTGFCYQCKECRKKYQILNAEKIKKWNKKYKIKNKEKIQEYYSVNKEKIREQRKQYRAENKGKISKRSKEYHKNNKEVLNLKSKRYREENKEYFKLYGKEYRKLNKEKLKKQVKKRRHMINKRLKNRRDTEPLFKLRLLLGDRIYAFFKTNKRKKGKKTREILGCSFEKAKLHLESTFKEGMTWNNHGKCGNGIDCSKVWHIDHKIPIASAKTEEEIYRLCHYTNLQALWANENLSKGDKLK